MRAGTVVVVASALPTGFFAVDRGAFTLYALLKLVVLTVPIAVVLSRDPLRHPPRSALAPGERARGPHVVVVGSFDAARQLSERIRRSRAGCVVGVCLPSAEHRDR